MRKEKGGRMVKMMEERRIEKEEGAFLRETEVGG